MACRSNGAHKLGYELSWLQLKDQDRERRASPAVRTQLGDHVKSAVHYTFVHDARNHPIRPTSGTAFKSCTEIAGLTPDTNVLRYVRQTLNCQFVSPLSPAVTLTVDTNVGVTPRPPVLYFHDCAEPALVSKLGRGMIALLVLPEGCAYQGTACACTHEVHAPDVHNRSTPDGRRHRVCHQPLPACCCNTSLATHCKGAFSNSSAQPCR